MKFSLIVATIGRTLELEKLLGSLATQSHPDFEVLVVDQNVSDDLGSMVSKYSKIMTIRWLRSKPGLSRARNVGLKQATGEIVCFPDDDCWYPKDLLRSVHSKFVADSGIGGVTGLPVNPAGRPLYGNWSKKAQNVNTLNVWACAISITIFLSRQLVEDVADFDETLGAGAEWFSGEETDYLIRAISKGYRILYDPKITCIHPDGLAAYTKESVLKMRKYNTGFGHVLRKHKTPIAQVCFWLIRPIAGMVLSLLGLRPAKALNHWAIFQGRLLGWVGVRS